MMLRVPWLRVRRISPYVLPAQIVVFTGLGLCADAIAHDLAVQRFLGVLTFATLAIAAWSSSLVERRQIWALVLVSTGVELFGSVLWGAYRYRLANVPLYVPPGHGLVLLFSLRLAATPLFERHALRWRGVALVAALAWSLAGLTLAPRGGWRLDVLGALCLPLFAVVVVTTGRGRLFVAAFFATSALEILGTAVGDWTWARVTPVVPIASGNPPSVIAGLYCCMDGLVLALCRVVPRLAATIGPQRPLSLRFVARSVVRRLEE